MLRLLHAADLHLGAIFPGLGSFGSTRESDFLKTFRRIVDLAIDREVQLFLLAGDLFDQPDPDPTLLATVQGELRRLVQRNICPVLLPGTHDHHLGNSNLYTEETFPDVVLLTDPLVDEPRKISLAGEDVYLYGLAFAGGRPADVLVGMRRRSSPGLHIGLLHGSLEGSPDWEYRSKDLPFTFPGLKQWDLDYVALGHYHRFQELQDSTRCWACYPGSPEGKRFGENGPRHVALVEVGERTARIEAIEIQSRILLEEEVQLDAGMSDTEIVNRICALGDEKSMSRVRLSGVLDRILDEETLFARCRPSFGYLELIDETRWLQGEFVSSVAEEETVRGECVRRFQELLSHAESPEEKGDIEQAFREVMVRFQTPGGEG